MVRRKRRKKYNSSVLEQVRPALLPAAALTAVPRTSSHKTRSRHTYLGSASHHSNTMGDADDGAFSDPESSLYDYQLMAEAGYSSVGFETWPNQSRRRHDRDKVSTPPFVRSASAVGRMAKSGDVYQQVLDPDDDEQSESFHLSSKGKGSGRKKGSQLSLEDNDTYLDRTQQNVRRAMQAVHDMPVEETLFKVEGMQTSATYPGSTSGRGTMRRSRGSGSSRSRTPRDTASFSLEMEIHRLKDENQQYQEELLNLRKVAAALRVGDEEGAATLMQNHQLDELKEENEVLKNTVGRLNQELSRYQAKYRQLSDEDISKLQGLPSEGPVPSWLINKRYLAPLFLAYDDLIQEKEEISRRCHEELQALKKRADEVVRENQRYQLQGGAAAGTEGRVGVSEWQQLQEQARLVLEENQVLMEQLDVQQNKIKDLCASHTEDVSRLTRKLTTIETEREEVDRELEDLKVKYKDTKQKYDKMLLDSGSRMTMQDHINTVADLKRSVTEEKDQFEKAKEKLGQKLKASDEERKLQTLAAIEVEAENKQLRAEIRALHKALRRSQNKMLILQKAIQQSENKEMITQHELANVIRIVEKTALERDTAFKVVKEQQRDCKDTVNQMLGNSVVMGKMEEKLKIYKTKASAKLHDVADKLKVQDDSFNRQRQEYEHEIRYLRLLVKEKEELIEQMEGMKKGVEEDLEHMWQAASSENRRLKDTVRNSVYKLREHASLRTALDDEEELEQLVHFSE